MAVIRRFARQIADRFHPDKIILFSSYAYGKPSPDSGVDLLVVMPASDEINQSIRLTLGFYCLFSLDLIARTPENLQRGLEEEDWFLREITVRGKVFYEKADSAMGARSRGRSGRRKKPYTDRTASP